MIERIYIDNVHSFVNYEWKPDRFALLFGRNGSGKTSLIEILSAVRRLVSGSHSVSETFPASSRTRWDTRAEQTIELDVRTHLGLAKYKLVVMQDVESAEEPVIERESLITEDGQSILASGTDFHVVRKGATDTFNGSTRHTRSVIGSLNLGSTPAFAAFVQQIHDLWVLRPDARAMSPRTDRRRTHGAPWLESNLGNFAAWYPPMLTRNPGMMFKANEDLRQAVDGLVDIFDDDGILAARFETNGKSTSFAIDELSDGERTLIALYTVLHAVAVPGKTLILDEPDNYLGLREIQPFLAELTDRALRTDGPQIIVISHHPEALNFLAPQRGWRMYRDRGGPSRTDRFESKSTLSPAEAVARGDDDPA